MKSEIFDFLDKDIVMPTIYCNQVFKFNEFERITKKENGKKVYKVCGKKLIDKGISKFENVAILLDMVKIGEDVYNKFNLSNSNQLAFNKNYEEAFRLGENIVKFCQKYGIPKRNENSVNIYNFSFICSDLFCRIMALIYINEIGDFEDAEDVKYCVEKANKYLNLKNPSISDIKKSIEPLETWDYGNNSLKVELAYNEDKKVHELIYKCDSLLDVAYLQLIFLLLSEDGLISSEGEILKIKVCNLCHNTFVTFRGNKKYCTNCNNESLRNKIRKQKSRKKNKESC